MTCLEELGAEEYEPPFGLRRAPTSLIGFSQFPSQVPDYEEDAEEYIAIAEKKEKELQNSEEKRVPLDEYVQNKNCEVVADSELGAYDTYMSRVDLNMGQWSGNTFYKMQLVRDFNRDVHFVFTRFGRVGTAGQYQLTPYGRKEEAVKEFKKIFKSKSGNDWENKGHFEKQPKKYRISEYKFVQS